MIRFVWQGKTWGMDDDRNGIRYYWWHQNGRYHRIFEDTWHAEYAAYKLATFGADGDTGAELEDDRRAYVPGGMG